jgi:hypothetical protein
MTLNIHSLGTHAVINTSILMVFALFVPNSGPFARLQRNLNMLKATSIHSLLKFKKLRNIYAQLNPKQKIFM